MAVTSRYSSYTLTATDNAMNAFTIITETIKLFGQKGTIFQVCQGNNVVKVCETREEAESWTAAK